MSWLWGKVVSPRPSFPSDPTSAGRWSLFTPLLIAKEKIALLPVHQVSVPAPIGS